MTILVGCCDQLLMIFWIKFPMLFLSFVSESVLELFFRHARSKKIRVRSRIPGQSRRGPFLELINGHGPFLHFPPLLNHFLTHNMSWFFASAAPPPPPAPTPQTSFGALGLTAATSLANDPKSQQIATDFAQDEGVQDAASTFASDTRVRGALLKAVGMPPSSHASHPAKPKKKNRKPSKAALAAMAAFQDSEKERIIEQQNPRARKKRSKGRGPLDPADPPDTIPSYVLAPLPNHHVPESFRQQCCLYAYVDLEEADTKQQAQQAQTVAEVPLVDLLEQLYHEHVQEGSFLSSGQVQDVLQIKEGQHLSSLLESYMQVAEPERKTLYYKEEHAGGTSRLALLMMQRIQLQAEEDAARKAW